MRNQIYLARTQPHINAINLALTGKFSIEDLDRANSALDELQGVATTEDYNAAWHRVKKFKSRMLLDRIEYGDFDEKSEAFIAFTRLYPESDRKDEAVSSLSRALYHEVASSLKDREPIEETLSDLETLTSFLDTHDAQLTVTSSDHDTL